MILKHALYLYQQQTITQQHNIMTTATTINSINKEVKALATDPAFIKAVRDAMIAQGITPSQWKREKVALVMTFAAHAASLNANG